MSAIMYIIAILTFLYPAIDIVRRFGDSSDPFSEWLRTLNLKQIALLQAMFLFALLLINFAALWGASN